MLIKDIPKVATVILNWNGQNFLEKFLPSIVKTTYTNHEIYVADNGSTDASMAFLMTHYPTIKIIDNGDNYGFAKGYNLALAQVEADYFVLLNSDVSVTPDWLNPIIELMERDPLIAACQPKIRSFDRPEYFEYAGAAGGFIDRLGYPFCRGRLFDTCEKDEGQYDEMTEIFWATGAALVVKSSIFKQFRGLDDDFFAHMEEIDLCWRIKRAGYVIVYCPESVVFHVGGGSLPQSSAWKTELNFRNNLVMLFKNEHFFSLLWLLPIRLLLDLIAALKLLLEGKKDHTKAVFKAHFGFFKKITFWLKKRRIDNKIIQNAMNVDTKPNFSGRYNRSILVAYFLKGKKKFSELQNHYF